MVFDSTIMKDPQGFIKIEDIRTILHHAKSRNLRDYVLLYTLYKSGRRISEVLRLEPQDIEVENGRILWNILKRRKEMKRWFNVTADLLKIIQDYIDLKDIDYGQRIFPITRQRAFQIVRYYGKKADCLYVGDRRIHPHHFRHSFAIHFIESGHETIEDLKFLQEYLGHASLNTTSWYLQFGKEMYKKKLSEMPEI